MTAETPFLIGSVSKSVTGLAVAQLVERGTLALEDTVEMHLPWFRLADADAASRITVAHLLGHRSGIPEGAYRLDHGSLEEGVRDLRNTSLVFPPGEGFEYSSVNYQILGRIVQEVTGTPFGVYLREHVFEPLGMVRSFTSQRTAERNGMATGHQYVLGHPVARRLPHDAGGIPNGYVVASTRDLTRYVQAHLNEGVVDDERVISPAAIRSTHTALASVDSRNEYGMGWILGERNGLRAVWHSGENPNFQAAIVMLPERDVGVVVLTNSASPLVGNVARRIATGVGSIVAGRTPPETGRTLPDTYVPVVGALAVGSLLEARALWNLGTYSDRLVERAPGWRALFDDAAENGLRSIRSQPRAWSQFARGVPISITRDLVLGVVLLLVVPRSFAPSLEAVWLGTPDLAVALVGVGILSLAKGAYKCWTSVRALRSGQDIDDA